jgi:YD repeat-containing protein
LNASGEREPYRVKGPDGDEIEYPPEQAKITTKDAMISVENTDKTTRYVYFLEGRLSSKNIATLTYWSQPRIKESALTGVLLMTLKDDYHRGTTMEGMMIGYDRKGMVFRGETEWRKIARNVPAA